MCDSASPLKLSYLDVIIYMAEKWLKICYSYILITLHFRDFFEL